MSEVQEVTYQGLCDLLSIEPAKDLPEVISFSDTSNLGATKTNQRLTAALQVLFELLSDDSQEVSKVDKVLIDNYIAKIDALASNVMDEILHNPDFLKIESTWRGLKYLIDRVDFSANTKISLLDIDKETLQEDFSDVPEITQSGLYEHIYNQEYDTPGGQPIAAVISNYEFDSGAKDIELLRSLSKVAAAAHAPFIGGVSAKFFSKKSMQHVSSIHDIKDYMEQPDYIRWNSFRDTEDSRYIGLVFPRFLLRLPYGIDNPTKTFCYQENITHNQHEQFLWGSASFAFAANIAASFKDHGWTVGIRGPEGGGKVANIPLHQYDAGRGIETKIPTEILIPETRELDFSDLGFIPLCYYKGSDFACFFSANSTNKAKIYDSADATANSKINSRLPYVFLASRLGHYLKVLQRENIGLAKEKAVLEKELNRWLTNLVTQMPNPGPELAAKRPLKAGFVTVDELSDNPGFYKVNLYAIPHFQVEGMDIKLSLVSQLPSGDK